MISSQHTRKVMSPQRPDLVLTSDIPDVEFGVLVGDGFDVEADGRDGSHVLVEFELVENCCDLSAGGLGAQRRRGDKKGDVGGRTRLSGGIQSQH
jgi:hypothetical protein